MNPLKDCESLIQRYFCKGYCCGKKADLSKTFGNRKKIVGNHAFFEFRDKYATIILK